MSNSKRSMVSVEPIFDTWLSLKKNCMFWTFWNLTKPSLFAAAIVEEEPEFLFVERIIFYSTLSFGQKDWKGFQPATRAKEKEWNAISGIKQKKWPFSKGLMATRPTKNSCTFHSCLLEFAKPKLFQNLLKLCDNVCKEQPVYFDGSLWNSPAMGYEGFQSV